MKPSYLSRRAFLASSAALLPALAVAADFRPSTRIQLELTEITGLPGEVVTVRGVLVSRGHSVSDRKLALTIDSLQIKEKFSNDEGRFRFSFALPSAGMHQAVIEFRGDPQFAPSSIAFRIIVLRVARLEFRRLEVPRIVTPGSYIPVRAFWRALDAMNGTPASGASVLMKSKLIPGGMFGEEQSRADSNGNLSFFLNLPPGSYRALLVMEARVLQKNGFAASSAPVVASRTVSA